MTAMQFVGIVEPGKQKVELVLGGEMGGAVSVLQDVWNYRQHLLHLLSNMLHSLKIGGLHKHCTSDCNGKACNDT